MHTLQLEETADTLRAGVVNVIAACDAFSVAGNYDRQAKCFVGKWATSPRGFQTKQTKTLVETWLATQTLSV